MSIGRITGATVGSGGSVSTNYTAVPVVLESGRPTSEALADAVLHSLGFKGDDRQAYTEEYGLDPRESFVTKLTEAAQAGRLTFSGLSPAGEGSYQGHVDLSTDSYRQFTNFIARRRAGPPTSAVPAEQTAKVQELRIQEKEVRLKVEAQALGLPALAGRPAAVPKYLEQRGYGSDDLSLRAINFRKDNEPSTRRNVAVFEFIQSDGSLRMLVKQSGGGFGHAERLIWKELEKAGVNPQQVTRIYSELEPCVAEGGYCKPWIARTFPEAKVTYSFEYGLSPESRALGLRQLRQAVEEHVLSK